MLRNLQFNELVSFLATVLGLATSAIGLLAIYRSSVRKGYAAERAFKHLEDHYAALGTAFKLQTETFEAEFKQLHKDHDRRFDSLDKDMSEVKMLMLTSHNSQIKRND